MECSVKSTGNPFLQLPRNSHMKQLSGTHKSITAHFCSLLGGRIDYIMGVPSLLVAYRLINDNKLDLHTEQISKT